MPARRSEAEALLSVKSILSRSDASQLINRRSSKGLSLLHAACIAGHWSVIDSLIQARLSLDVNALYEDWSPIMLAARGQHIECVKVLAAAGADIQPLLDQDPDQSTAQSSNRPKKRSSKKLSCLPLDASLRRAMISAALTGSDEYRNALHSVMTHEPMLADMPIVLIDIIMRYVTHAKAAD